MIGMLIALWILPLNHIKCANHAKQLWGVNTVKMHGRKVLITLFYVLQLLCLFIHIWYKVEYAHVPSSYV